MFAFHMPRMYWLFNAIGMEGLLCPSDPALHQFPFSLSSVSFLSFCLFGFIIYIFDIFRTDFIRYGLRTDAPYFIRCSNERVHLFQDRIKNWILDCKTLFKRLSKYSWLYAIFIHIDFRTNKRLPYHTSWEEYLTSTICELRIHYTENTVYTIFPVTHFVWKGHRMAGTPSGSRANPTRGECQPRDYFTKCKAMASAKTKNKVSLWTGSLKDWKYNRWEEPTNCRNDSTQKAVRKEF